jgi:hypothetical protein
MSLQRNRPKSSQTHFSSKLMHNFYRGKEAVKFFGLLLSFSKTKQSHKMRKLAQSGHPAFESPRT